MFVAIPTPILRRHLGKLFKVVGLGCIVSLVSQPLSAQSGGFWEMDFKGVGISSGDQLGKQVANAGDVNNDGTDDYVVGAPFADPQGKVDAGSVFVFSGSDHQLIWNLKGSNAGLRLGYSVASAGDVDFDGHADVLIGIPFASPGITTEAGSVIIVSGATSATLRTYNGTQDFAMFGASVANAGDVDGDNRPDQIIGAPLLDHVLIDAGAAYVYAGSTGALLRRIDGIGSGYQMGFKVRGAGDWNSDNRDDVMASAPYAEPSGILEAGAIWVVDILTGSLLDKYQGEDPGGLLGSDFDILGDITGDDFPDVIAGAPFAAPGGTRTAAGAAVIFSGRTSNIIKTYYGPEKWDRLGASVAGAEDFDLDGVPDFLIGIPGAAPFGDPNAGKVRVHSGRTSKSLQDFVGLTADDAMGTSVASLGDLDFDGRSEILIGAPFAEDNGNAFVFSWDPYIEVDTNELSSALGGTVTISLSFPSTEAGLSYLLLASLAGTGPSLLKDVWVPLTEDVYYNQMKNNNPPPNIIDASGVLDANGQGTAFIVNVPGGMAQFIGSRIYVAAVSLVPPGDPRFSSASVVVDVVP